MARAVVSLSDKRPEVPRADFAFEIDFKKGAGPASRVFTATHDFIKACEALDAELVQSIDASIETVLVLEDIETGSIKTWLRSVLVTADDSALKKLDWKPLVGEYLVRAKYAVIRWIDEDPNHSLPDLRRSIQLIAAETDVRQLPDYSPPSPIALTNAIRDFQSVKDRLVEGDTASLITDDGSIRMNLSVRFDIEDIEELAVARRIHTPSSQMILAVKKPDYLGTSKWELRHGKRTISAKIEDEAWLTRFQHRNVDVRPGDALLCEVSIEILYGHDNELVAEKYTVQKVIDVLSTNFTTIPLPFDDDNLTEVP